MAREQVTSEVYEQRLLLNGTCLVPTEQQSPGKHHENDLWQSRETHFKKLYDIFIRAQKYTMTVTWEKEEEEKMDVQGNIDKIKKYMERKSFSYSP